ncbi:spike base protein, RCAP_Rcc01079 family [Roseicyclus persicicus]|uniref:Uncharacterized protein n=1 Tax=Roseicyclus persicicus TaxID=2650661 RepID=A0A7X6JY02_9RHOB|nr:hypothetical protein [Roseibacterium persicicum]NKX43600.1 hypothetical protein [Roseibacterium persicicum]
MTRDPFDDRRSGLNDPAEGLIQVTPSDTTDLGVICRGLYVGNAGDVAVRASDNTEGVFENVAAGTFLPVRARRVLETGTTATGILGLY